jgi:hypothetical protein
VKHPGQFWAGTMGSSGSVFGWRQHLREAGVPESTVADILWHSNPSMTRHYSVAQIVELHSALKKIKEDTGRWNKSLATLKQEHEATKRRTMGA